MPRFRTLRPRRCNSRNFRRLHHAGRDLADLTAEEVFEMKVEQRIELLKSNILHYSKHILNFDVLEIRLLGDRNSEELVPLLSVGIEAEAAARPLLAQVEGYGVTGFRRRYRHELSVFRHSTGRPIFGRLQRRTQFHYRPADPA